MASGIQPSKDERRPKAQLTKTTSLTVGIKPKHRGAGCSSMSKSASGSAGLSALMLREMEDLRNLSIGSPVPTPQTDDDESVFAGAAFDAETFPAIRIDRCSTGDASEDNGPSRRSEDRGRNGRPRQEAAKTTKDGAARRRSASNHAKSDQRRD